MHLHTGCSHWVRCAPWSERRLGSTHYALQGFDAPGLRGGGRCRWRCGAGRFCTAQFALHPTRIVFPSLHGAHCMRPQVEAQRCSPRDRRRRAPRKGKGIHGCFCAHAAAAMLAARSPPPRPSQRHPWVLLCSCGRRPGCRPPAQIAVSPPPPSNSHRLLRPLYTRAPFIYPRFPCVISVTSRASARSLADFPPFPPTCAQVRNSTIYLKLTRPRRGEAVIAVWNNPTGLGGRCGATLGLVGRALWR